jgi:hypothetical protein
LKTKAEAKELKIASYAEYLAALELGIREKNAKRLE